MIDPPVAEGFIAPGLWAVAYAMSDGAVDVLVYRAKQHGTAVDLGACIFAGRLRGETWHSTIGTLGARELAAVTRWATTHPPP